MYTQPARGAGAFVHIVAQKAEESHEQGYCEEGSHGSNMLLGASFLDMAIDAAEHGQAVFLTMHRRHLEFRGYAHVRM